MNPIVRVDDDEHVTYELTDDDRKKMDAVKLGGYAELYEVNIADFGHAMCVMQLVSMLTTEAGKITPEKHAAYLKYRVWENDGYYGTDSDAPTEFDGFSVAELEDLSYYGDTPICVSDVITQFMIELNDNHAHAPEDFVALRALVPEIINTCPVKATTYADGLICETREHTEEYSRAEAERVTILNEARDSDEFSDMLEAVRRAAAVV